MPTTSNGSSAKRARSAGSAAEPIVYATIFVSMACVFVADLFTPLGIVVWVIYVIPVALSLSVWRPEVPLVVAAVSTAMMIWTFMTDTPGVDPTIALLNRGFGVVTIWVLAVVGYLFIRFKLAVRRQEWLQNGEVGLNGAIAGEQRLEQLGESALKFLGEYLEAEAGAFFVRDGGGFKRVAAYGVPSDANVPEGFDLGDGLLGQAAKDRRTIVLNSVPEGFLTIGSAFGRGTPRHLIIFPASTDRAVHGVMEIGFMRPIPVGATDLLTSCAEAIAVAIRAAQYRANLQALLEETQRQAEELQAQGEELRVTNEELEEQSRALRESQNRLEQQQAELEQTNAQLEEQAELLENQQASLERANTNLKAKARELDQASRYKSDFLANMSHELRTPLNSSLILAKLLADNPAGNLTEEQIEYARTIQSAGNDLLALINDILDLSKIEAGRMEMRAESVPLADLADSLLRTFEPVAGERGLEFHCHLSPACPDAISTDRLRLEQVLKNLLSNAFKFTEQGRVTLEITPAVENALSFAVTDTGVGIPADQHDVIFEAFKQGDGTANRRFSGTGLGLSISRELARLLGGDVALASEPGRGSTFTVTIPTTLPQRPAQRPESPAHEQRHTSQASIEPPPQERRPQGTEPLRPATNGAPIALPRARIKDDRDSLHQNDRVLLVVEDDETFAKILMELARQTNFKCIAATTAEEALQLVAQFVPSAVVLDVGLPDHSGLTVLDRLKHDPKTRHIPVHVVSGADYAETALSLGAVGYLLKPVKREDLLETLEHFQERLNQRARRILVVEDDPSQREALQRFLGSNDVETVGAGTAAECLEQLKRSTFDCMVLDLSLPDASGYTLLETLSQESAYSFPPVIVYTGRDLSFDEEQRLRRYSKSIIIKGAKSHERLLDEVTLFLHQVVAELPPDRQRMLEQARSRDAALEGRRILIVEDDVRNVFALTSILEPRGAIVQIARNGREAVKALEQSLDDDAQRIDLVLMDVMMPEMDGLTATREIRQRPQLKRLPVIMLTAKAMRDDQEKCIAAGANDYMAKPLDVEKLLSLIRVWMPR